MKRLLQFLLGCPHRRETFPQRAADGLDYVCCLDCGTRRRYRGIEFAGRQASRPLAEPPTEPPTGIERTLNTAADH